MVTAMDKIEELVNGLRYLLAECIIDALETANPQRYKSSMQTLICKDIQNALESIHCVQREI